MGVKTFNNIRRRLYVVLTFAGRSVRAHALYDSSWAACNNCIIIIINVSTFKWSRGLCGDCCGCMVTLWNFCHVLTRLNCFQAVVWDYLLSIHRVPLAGQRLTGEKAGQRPDRGTYCDVQPVWLRIIMKFVRPACAVWPVSSPALSQATVRKLLNCWRREY